MLSRNEINFELRYILAPKEVHGEDFPGETFRVLKEKEIKQFGKYRTRRLVLEAWDGQGKDEGGMMKDEFGYVRVVREKEVRLYGDAPQSDEEDGVGGVGWARSRMKDEL
jgi:hypothetical protein